MVYKPDENIGSSELADNLLSIFSDANISANNEVEIKTVVDGINDLDGYSPLIQELKDKLSANEIFNGTLHDARLYDNKDKNDSDLKKNGIYLLRFRKEHVPEKGKKDIFKFTLKIGNGVHAIEYEKNVKMGFLKKVLIGKHGLLVTESERKKKIELEFIIEVNGKNEKIKIAFDEYQKNNKSKNDYSKLPAYFEVEAENDEVLKIGLEKILELDFFRNKQYKHTYNGKRLMLEEQTNDKVKAILNESKECSDSDFSIIINGIKNAVLDAIAEKNPYFSTDSFLNDKNENYSDIEDIEFYTDLNKLIRNNIERLIEKNSAFGSYFSRMMNNPVYDYKNKDKKFDDKFEREFSGYIRALSTVILDDIKRCEFGIDKEENNKIINKIIKDRLDSFLRLLFIFNDSLVKPELINVLSKIDKRTANKQYFQFKRGIEKIYANISEIPNIWDGYSTNNKKEKTENEKTKEAKKFENRILDRLSTSYSRAFAASAYKGEFGDIDIIEAKQEDIEREQFEFIAKQFSHWLNSPTRDINMLTTIKNLFLEDAYHIFLLSKKHMAFQEFKVNNKTKFDQNFIDKVFKHFKSNILNENNFILHEKGPKLFERFVHNIFSDNSSIKDDIESDYIDYNIQANMQFIKKGSSLNSNPFNKGIHFDNWKNSSFDNRLFTFLDQILNIGKNGVHIKRDYLYARGTNNNVIKKLVEAEFLKTHKSIGGNYENEFNNYLNEVETQLEFLDTCFVGVEDLKNKNDRINYLLLNYTNEVQLLVSFFQFNLKVKKNKKDKDDKPRKNKLILSSNLEESTILDGYKLSSQTFIERIVNRINADEQITSGSNSILGSNPNNFEFITSCSSGYNSSVYTNERMIDLHDRIGNDKPIDLDKSFYFNSNGRQYYLKDFTTLYLPSEDENNYIKIRKFQEKGLETDRKLLNGDMISDNDPYFSRLKSIGFPIKDYVALKKLLEFLKFSYKMVLPYLNDLYKEALNTTGKYIEILHRDLDSYNYLKNHHIDDPKELSSLIRKGISKHGGNLEKINDNSRTTIFGINLQELENSLFEFIRQQSRVNGVKSLRFEDKIGNIFKKAIRENGYRDSSLVITTEQGETIEVQFQLVPYYLIKIGNLVVSEVNGKKVLNLKNDDESGFEIENFDIGDKIQKKIIDNDKDNDLGKFFNSQQKRDFIEFCKISGQKIPKSFAIIASIDIPNYDNIIDENIEFNADWTYKIERTFGKNNEEVNRKLMLLDKILFDIANGYLMQQERERVRKLKEKPNKKNTKRKKNRKKG